MLGSLFLFSGRIGRGRYFLWDMVFIPVVTFVSLRMLPELNSDFWPSKSSHLVALLLIYLVSGWMGVSLQAARIRDIGWKPGMIILGLCVLNGVILAIDYFFHTWSTETHFFAIFTGGRNRWDDYNRVLAHALRRGRLYSEIPYAGIECRHFQREPSGAWGV